ncbi:hypothetical protein CWI36_0685p0020 [Hamiltosporidium magnivora]|uniref:Uncharacterized protein n=1 Tax=Hamiltosporidium magnivora TaxID=148818 RepID=A0A4Q9LCC4_9MICR|nr:hypothetical protein CWI36_0685p0020 [Hamiltosporidium magnivora]
MKLVIIKLISDTFCYLFYDDQEAFIIDLYDDSIIDKLLSSEINKDFLDEKDIEALNKKNKERKLIFAFFTEPSMEEERIKTYLKTKYGDSTKVFLPEANNKKEVTIKHMKDDTIIKCIKTPVFFVKLNDNSKAYIAVGNLFSFLGCNVSHIFSKEMYVKSLNKIKKEIDKESIVLYKKDEKAKNLAGI